jgi:hypothetical protein
MTSVYTRLGTSMHASALGVVPNSANGYDNGTGTR